MSTGDILDSEEAGRRFLRGGSLRVVSYIGGLGIGLIATPFVVRHLGPSDWGLFITVTSLIFVVAALTEGGLANLGVREFSTLGRTEREGLLGDLLGLRIALTGVGAIGAVVFTVIAGYPGVVVAGTAIATVGLLGMTTQFTAAVPLTASLRLGWLALIDLLPQLTTAVLMLTLVVLGASLLPFLAITAAAAVPPLVLTVILVRREVPLRPRFDRGRWKALAGESLVYATATALGIIYFRIVILAMSVLSSEAQTGYFSLSFRVLDLVNGVPWLVVTSAFPILARAARDDDERLRYGLQRLMEGGLLVGGWFSLCLVLGAPIAVDVVGGSDFEPSITVLRILGAGTIATFLVATWVFALLSLKMYRELIVINGGIVALAIALSAILIPAEGAQGAAIVTVALEVVLAAGYGLVLARRRPDLRPRLGATPRVMLALAIALAAGGALYEVPVVAVIVASLVLAVASFALRAVPEELLQAVRSRTSASLE